MEIIQKTGAEVEYANFFDPGFSPEVKNITNNTVLYIGVHGSERNRLESKSDKPEEQRRWSYQEFAAEIAKLLHHLKIDKSKFDPQSPRTTVVLTTCYGAMPRDSSLLNSLAAKIQAELALEGIFVDIQSMQSRVTVSKDGIETTQLEGNEKHLLANYKLLQATSESRAHPAIIFSEIQDEDVSLELELKKFQSEVAKIEQDMGEVIPQRPYAEIAFTWEKDEKSQEIRQVAYVAEHLKKFKEGSKLIVTEDEKIDFKKCCNEYVLVQTREGDEYRNQLYYVDFFGKEDKVNITNYDSINFLQESADPNRNDPRFSSEFVYDLSMEQVKNLITDNSTNHHSPCITPYEKRSFSDIVLFQKIDKQNYMNQKDPKSMRFSMNDLAQDWSKEERIRHFIIDLKKEIKELDKVIKAQSFSTVAAKGIIVVRQQRDYLTSLCADMDKRSIPSPPGPSLGKALQSKYESAKELLKNRDLYFVTSPDQISSQSGAFSK